MPIEGLGNSKPLNFGSQPVKTPAGNVRENFLDLAMDGLYHSSTGNIDFAKHLEDGGAFFSPPGGSEERSFMANLMKKGFEA